MVPRRASFLLLVTVAGCLQKEAPEPVPVLAAPQAPPPSACSSPSELVPIDSKGSSSPLALARLGGRRVALLADEDDAALRVVELEGGRILGSVSFEAAPGHVIVSRDGRAFVSLPELDSVVELTMSKGVLSECGRTSTKGDPLALAVTDDATLVVATRGGHTLTMVPRKGPPATIGLSPDPTAVLLSGPKTAIVAHGAGSVVSVVDLERHIVAREVSLAWRDRIGVGTVPVADMPRFAVQARSLASMGNAIAIPLVVAYPGETRLNVTFTSGYGPASVRGVDGYFPHEAAIASLGLDGAAPRLRLHHEVVAEHKQRYSVGRIASPPDRPPCLLPRSTAVDGTTLAVACLGIDRLLLFSGDGTLEHAERARIEVPAGPVAVAIDPAADEAVVWSQFARVLSVIPLADPSHARALPLAADRPRDAVWAAGRATFHSPIGFDGRACASCHPDGGSDGLVWSSPHGPMQPPVLAGRLEHTAPFGWLGGAPTLEAHLGQTMPRLGAKPMPKETMAPLIAYVVALPPRAKRPLDALEKRGRALFVSAECANCHEKGGTDGLRHDVGTGGSFDTPSLASLSNSAPYMHDGRFGTLREVIVQTAGKMGAADHLSEDEVKALIAYLETL